MQDWSDGIKGQDGWSESPYTLFLRWNGVVGVIACLQQLRMCPRRPAMPGCAEVVCCLAILMIDYLAARSQVRSPAVQLDNLPLRYPAPGVVRAPLLGQQLRFAKAATYNSGGWSTVSVVVANLNRDSHPDLIVVNACKDELCGDGGLPEGSADILLGNGNGTFQPAVSYGSGAPSATSAAVGDLNGDGLPDLVVATCDGRNCTSGEVGVLLGNGDGTFQPSILYSSSGYNATSVATGDLNADGNDDVVVANSCPSQEACDVGRPNGSVSILLANSAGALKTAATYDSGGRNPVFVTVADVNSDGNADVLVANGCDPSNDCLTGSVGVLFGNGDGTFQPVMTYDVSQPQSIAVGDMDGDDIPDLAVANYGFSSMSVLLGKGDGTFDAPVSYLTGGHQAQSIAVGDVNGDGKSDIAVANFCSSGKHGTNCRHGSVSLFLGTGDGTFQTPMIINSGGLQAESVAIKDVNMDGRPDLIMTNRCVDFTCHNGSVAVFLNTTPPVSTTTALTSSLNPSQINQQTILKATISSSPSIPDGEPITFYDGTTKIGSGTTVNGIASLTISFSVARTHTIKAKYPGDSFRKASSGSVTQVVNP